MLFLRKVFSEVPGHRFCLLAILSVCRFWDILWDTESPASPLQTFHKPSVSGKLRSPVPFRNDWYKISGSFRLLPGNLQWTSEAKVSFPPGCTYPSQNRRHFSRYPEVLPQDQTGISSDTEGSLHHKFHFCIHGKKVRSALHLPYSHSEWSSGLPVSATHIPLLLQSQMPPQRSLPVGTSLSGWGFPAVSSYRP